jgi:hypothetical protein
MSTQPDRRCRATSRAAVLAAFVVTAVAAPAPAQAGGQLGSGPVIVRPPPSLRETAPESGAGLITGGSFGIIGGTTLMVLGSYMAASTGHGDWAGAIVGGAALAAGGSTFVWLGTRRARIQRAWAQQHGLQPPPKGRALLISGLVLGGGGVISMIAYGGLSLGYCESNCFNPNQGAWFGIAGSAVGVGLGMVIAGGVLRSQHRRWVEQGDTVRVRITPTFAFSPAGAQLGVAGRF